MGDKSVETLCNKIEFLSILVTFPPFPPKQCWFFYFFDCTDHIAYTTLNWGAGGIRELTLEANKMEQMLKYQKASFPKSVSTAFVAHCSRLKNRPARQLSRSARKRRVAVPQSRLAWQNSQIALTRSSSVPFKNQKTKRLEHNNYKLNQGDQGLFLSAS